MALKTVEMVSNLRKHPAPPIPITLCVLQLPGHHHHHPGPQAGAEHLFPHQAQQSPIRQSQWWCTSTFHLLSQSSALSSYKQIHWTRFWSFFFIFLSYILFCSICFLFSHIKFIVILRGNKPDSENNKDTNKEQRPRANTQKYSSEFNSTSPKESDLTQQVWHL